MDGPAVEGDDVVLEGVDPFLGLALLLHEAVQGDLDLAQASEEDSQVGEVLAGVVKAGVGPEQADGLQWYALCRNGWVLYSEAAARQDVHLQGRRGAEGRLVHAATAHAQVRDAEAAECLLERLSRLGAQVAVFADSLVDQAG